MRSNKARAGLVAVGCHDPRDTGKDKPQIVIRFDRETFDQVRAFAQREGISFNSAARLLIEWGLEADRVATSRHIEQVRP